MRSCWILLGVGLSACTSSHTEPTACPVGHSCIVAGTGENGAAGEGGSAREVDLSLPIDVALGPDGHLFVVDWNNNRVLELGDDGRLRAVVGTGELGALTEGLATETALNHPSGVAFDDEGRMLLAAWLDGRVARVDLARGTLEILAGTGERAYHGEGGAGTAAAFDLPAAVIPDGDGLLITDQLNQVIRRLGADGTVERFAGACVTGACGAAVALACEGSDKRTCPADVDACALRCVDAFSGDGGPAVDARFGFGMLAMLGPGGRIARGPGESVYVADTINHRVRRIAPDGTVTTFAGTGEPGFGGDGRSARAAQLDAPRDVAVDEDGSVYIADAGAACVRVVHPDGTIATAAGTCGVPGNGEHEGTAAALLDRPFGVDVGDGRLFVADTGNHVVRVIGLR